MSLQNVVDNYLNKSKKTLDFFVADKNKKEIIASGVALSKTLKKGGKILICGNGGSAAHAQHFAAELIGRFKIDRIPFPAISLNTDTSAITAIANDYDFSKIFSRQIEGLGKKGDCLIAISTSGQSKNIIDAVLLAKKKKIKVIGLTGMNKSRLTKISDICIQVPTKETCYIQELHTIVIHLLCTLIEFNLVEKK